MFTLWHKILQKSALVMCIGFILLFSACGADTKDPQPIAPDVPGDWNMTRDELRAAFSYERDFVDTSNRGMSFTRDFPVDNSLYKYRFTTAGGLFSALVEFTLNAKDVTEYEDIRADYEAYIMSFVENGRLRYGTPEKISRTELLRYQETLISNEKDYYIYIFFEFFTNRILKVRTYYFNPASEDTIKFFKAHDWGFYGGGKKEN